ncbi:MAG: phospholipase D-like domain-containing protein [Terracidiphilus sp.]|nr:phospholipase D-like domain-containing protein [Terracidiphilus sp.]
METTMRSWGKRVLLCGSVTAVALICLGSCGSRLIPVHAAMGMAADAAAQAVAQVAPEVHYSPAENLETIDLTELDQARSTLDVSAYAMDDRPIAEELVKLAGRGVKIRIYRDQQQYMGEKARGAKGLQDLNALFSGQPNIQVRVKGVTALAHLKAYLVDGKMLREGSANWSPQGEKVQDNSLILIRDPAAVAAFEKQFEAMWSRTSNEVIH